MRRLVYGVGVNDADYIVQPTINGKRVRCSFYRAWKEMLRRCYSVKSHKERPTYIGCSVALEWLIFSNFRAWMIQQDWEGNQLDKDILITGNKVYSPETCAFVSGQLNSFMANSGAARGEWLIGCYWNKQNKKFLARCNNPFTKKQEFLGYYDIQIPANLKWRTRKHELALVYADMQTDPRIAQALRTRFI